MAPLCFGPCWLVSAPGTLSLQVREEVQNERHQSEEVEDEEQSEEERVVCLLQ